MPAEQPADSLAGQLVGGRYRLIRRIGKGGMGVVYEAEHALLDKRVAVKFLLDRFTEDPEVVERFHREARLASRIGQDNIIDVVDVGRADHERPYIVMELLDGADLGNVLARSGPMPAARACHIIRQVLRGLDAAHGKGIVHRDMKPENVFLVERAGDPDFVKIMDFGISKIIAANDSKVRLTATGAVIGTPVYMAPEQAMAQAELDHRVDLYAVGVMLFELLAGRPPFMANNYLGLVTQHLNSPPPSLAGLRPDLPPAVCAVVQRALEKDPDRRWQSAAEFARALPAETTLRSLDAIATLGDTDGVRVVAPRATPEPTTVRRRRAGWAVAGALVVVAAAIGVAIAMRDEGDPVVTPAAKEEPPPPEPPAPEVVTLGRIDVRATPAGVKVYVDDVYKGSSPVMITGIPAGMHDVRLEKEGHQTIATTVIVGGAAPYVVDDALPRLETSPAPADAKAPTKGTRPPRSTRPQPEKQPDKQPDRQPEPEKRPGGNRPGQKPNPYD